VALQQQGEKLTDVFKTWQDELQVLQMANTANSEIVVRGRPIEFENSKNQKNSENSENSFTHYTHLSSLV